MIETKLKSEPNGQAAPDPKREGTLHQVFPFLKNKYSFSPQYDFGKKDLLESPIESSAFNIFGLIRATLDSRGEQGFWSFSHHAHRGDFLTLLASILNDIPFLSEKNWPEGWKKIAELRREMEEARSAGDQLRLTRASDQVFNFAKAAQQNLLWEMQDSILFCLRSAARTFVKNSGGVPQIWASAMDWFQQEWGRDTFISLPGILLTSGRQAEAKDIIRNFARLERRGIIPNRIWDASRPEFIEYNTVDGSLWFIQAVQQVVERSDDWDFAREMLQSLRHITEAYMKGTDYIYLDRLNRIRMDEDGMIASPPQATWMDADPNGQGHPVTPRNGKTVEINALWYADLRFMAEVEKRSGEMARAYELSDVAEKVRKSFNEKFWNPGRNALYDVIEGDPTGASVRPNMIFAVSHGGDLLSPERQELVFETVARELLTPFGLRTLSPSDRNYHGRYDTHLPPGQKDLAYHQGTVWPWLLGGYADALVRVRKYQGKGRDEIKAELKSLLAPLCEFLLASEHQTLPEVFDGDAPHRQGGTRSQAWSVAEVLRIFEEYLQR